MNDLPALEFERFNMTNPEKQAFYSSLENVEEFLKIYERQNLAMTLLLETWKHCKDAGLAIIVKAGDELEQEAHFMLSRARAEGFASNMDEYLKGRKQASTESWKWLKERKARLGDDAGSNT